jgi:peptide/nickel transport system substrate-binding protein
VNRKFLQMLMAAVVAVGLFVAPALAQEPLGPGEGQPVVLGNFGGDIITTNPLLVADGSSGDVVAQLYPNFIGVDPESGVETPGAAKSLATDWSYNEDGTVLTVNLRDDWQWSDGTPITSADVKYAYEAIISGEIDTVLGSYLTTVVSVEIPDDYTVEITFAEPDCAAVTVATNIPVVPAHYFSEVYPSFAEMTTESPANLNPEVTAGPFSFANFRSGEQVTLLANQDYPDSPAGYVVPEGFVYKNTTDQLVEVEQFLDGQLTYISIPEDRQAEMEERGAAGEFVYLERPATGWQIVLFNLANPENPQPGLDEEGNVIEQESHPILGDLNVRKAISHAVDHEALNEGAYEGTGIPVGGAMLPQSWAYNENLEPHAYDPELAMQLLEESGWVDTDGDGIREKDGQPLALTLGTYTGNVSIDAFNVLMQDQLKQVGIDVELEIMEFGVLVDDLLNQTYDMIVLFWGVSTNAPQDMYDMLSAEADAPGASFGVTSFYNEEFETLMKEARVLPGCDTEERKAMYDRAQEIIYDNAPWLLVNTSMVPIAVTNNLENFDPKTNSLIWNLPAWSLR